MGQRLLSVYHGPRVTAPSTSHLGQSSAPHDKEAKGQVDEVLSASGPGGSRVPQVAPPSPQGLRSAQGTFPDKLSVPCLPKGLPSNHSNLLPGERFSHVTGLSASWRPIGGPRDLSWPTGSLEQPNSAWFWPRNSRGSPGVYRCSVRHILRVYVFTKIAAGKSCRLQACPPHTRQGADREPGPLTKGCTPPAAQSPVLLRWACGAFVHGGWVRPCAWAMGVNGTLGSKFSTRHSVKAKTEVGGG